MLLTTLDQLPYRFRVPALVDAVPPARRRVRAVVQGLNLSLDDDTLAAIELLAGEVIANAVLHTDGSCAVCLRWTGTRLRVEVTDIGKANTKLMARVAAPDDENGRGLLLVEAMADDWGTLSEPEGKTTWFEISAKPTDPPSFGPLAARSSGCPGTLDTWPASTTSNPRIPQPFCSSLHRSRKAGTASVSAGAVSR